MSFAKLRQDYTPLPSVPASQLTSELDGVVPTHSPARTLQQQLVRRTGTAENSSVTKWSPRSSVALIVSASAAMWIAILMVGAGVSAFIA